MLQCPAQSLLLQFGLPKSSDALVSNCAGALKLSFKNSLQILPVMFVAGDEFWCWELPSCERNAAAAGCPVKFTVINDSKQMSLPHVNSRT